MMVARLDWASLFPRSRRFVDGNGRLRVRSRRFPTLPLARGTKPAIITLSFALNCLNLRCRPARSRGIVDPREPVSSADRWSGVSPRFAPQSPATMPMRMRPWFIFCLLIAGLLSNVSVAIGAVSSPASGPHPHNGRYRTDRILIKPKQDGAVALSSLHSRRGSRVMRSFRSLDNLQLVRIPQGASVEAVIAEYKQSGLVEFAEPDYLVRMSAVPNDPKYVDGTLWGFRNTGQSGGLSGADIGAVAGWDVLNSASNVIVAVIDTGVRYTHEDLAANMWVNDEEIPGNGIDDDDDGYVDDVHGINAIDNSGDPLDDVGHGTHVSGILGAVGNNAKGVVGVAWKVQIMALKFMDDTGFGSHSDAVQCIDYARTHGAHVINASWGGTSSSLSLRSAISRARTAGIVFVAAAGNESQDDDIVGNYPSGYDYDNVISVGSSTRSDGLADFSNYGAVTVDLVAPGATIYSTWNSSDRGYTFNSGTSMSTPFVTGVFALLRARFPNDTPKQLIDRVLAATDAIPALAGKCTSGGRLNLHRALSANLLANFSASRLSGPPPLTVSFRDSSVGSVASHTWNFGDGAISSEASPVHVFNSQGDYIVTLTVADSNGVTSQKSRTITVLANYKIVSTNYNWIDPAQMTRLILTDNGVSPAQSLTFPFLFYGQARDRIYVAANGMIGFVNQGLTQSSNIDLPSTSTPNAMICPYWDNLNPAAGGSVRFGVIGDAPNRRAVISWVAVPRNSTPTESLTFQALLLEGSNEIIFQYLDVRPGISRGAGRAATVGVENDTGTVAAKYTFDGSPSVLSNNQALAFLPSSAGGIVVSPASTVVVAGQVGGPFTPSTQTYLIENRGPTPARWSVYCLQEWTSLSATGGTLAPGQKTNVTASLTDKAAGLSPGSYLATLSFYNDDTGVGNTTRAITLEVDGSTGMLTVTPELGLVSFGPSAGPFTPVSQIFTLLNTGDARIDWRATTAQEWITLSMSSGTLAAGASATVVIQLNEDATALPVGMHSGEVLLSNTSNNLGTTARKIALDVRPAGQSRLALASSTSDGRFRFRVTGDPGVNYVIQSSTDLSRWTPVSTNTVEVDGFFEFSGTKPPGDKQSFFRAVVAP
jgi:subtilisin family serine protease